MQALIQSDDVRSMTLLVGTVVIGFVVAGPSPALVRVAFVAAATAGIAAWVLAQHEAVDSVTRKDEAQATTLFDPTSSSSPFAMLLHPEASSAIASLSDLSSPGRRSSVHLVVLTTENVVRTYHAILGATAGQGRGSAGTDDLRDRTSEALDALQALRMETGSFGHAADIAVSAERRLRRLFIRFRQIAGNKMKSPGLYGAPYPLDPRDDHSFLR